jgi:type II secretion system protein N
VKELLAAIKARLTKLAPRIGFPLFYVVCLVLFASWTFPYERLKERIVVSFNAGQRASGSTQELAIDQITSSWITGVKMRGIKLTSPAPEPDKPPSEMTIDDATARISLLGILVGNRDISFDVNAFGGSISGSFDDHGKDRDIDVTFDSVDVGKVTVLRDALGLPMEGTLGGNVKLTMPEPKAAPEGKAPAPETKASKAAGSVSLDVQNLAIGDGKAKLKGALALPRVAVGTLSLAGEAKDGVLTIKKLGAGGKDVELQGDGRITLRDVLNDSLVDMNVRFKINDAYRTKNDVTKSLFGAPGSNAPALFELADPKVKQSKRPDGFYAWHVRGQLGRPDFAPAGGAFPMPTFGSPAFAVPPIGAGGASGGAAATGVGP